MPEANRRQRRSSSSRSAFGEETRAHSLRRRHGIDHFSLVASAAGSSAGAVPASSPADTIFAKGAAGPAPLLEAVLSLVPPVLASGQSTGDVMDLTYSDKYVALSRQVAEFIAEHGHRSPRWGGGRSEPTRKHSIGKNCCSRRAMSRATFPASMAAPACHLDLLELAVIADAFAQAGVDPGLRNQGISMLVPTLLEVGTPEQRQRWIEPTLRGEIIWCQGYSEPGSGSDLANARTSATSRMASSSSTARRSGPPRHTMPT